jgi:hypothetical protein
MRSLGNDYLSQLTHFFLFGESVVCGSKRSRIEDDGETRVFEQTRPSSGEETGSS